MFISKEDNLLWPGPTEVEARSWEIHPLISKVLYHKNKELSRGIFTRFELQVGGLGLVRDGGEFRSRLSALEIATIWFVPPEGGPHVLKTDSTRFAGSVVGW